MVDFTPEHPFWSNFQISITLEPWGWNFQGLIISTLSTNSEKNKQNLRGKGVNIQKCSMIWHGITQKPQVTVLKVPSI